MAFAGFLRGLAAVPGRTPFSAVDGAALPWAPRAAALPPSRCRASPPGVSSGADGGWSGAARRGRASVRAEVPESVSRGLVPENEGITPGAEGFPFPISLALFLT